MRDDEARLVDHSVAEEQQVEIDRARPPPRPDPLAPEPALDVEQERQEGQRLETGLDRRDRVHERGLVLEAPRGCLDDRRETIRADQLGGVADEPLAVAEVGAETDVRDRHGRSTVTALNSTVSPAGLTCGLRTRSRSDSGSKRSMSMSATAVASASSRLKRCADESS